MVSVIRVPITIVHNCDLDVIRQQRDALVDNVECFHLHGFAAMQCDATARLIVRLRAVVDRHLKVFQKMWAAFQAWHTVLEQHAVGHVVVDLVHPIVTAAFKNGNPQVFERLAPPLA